MSLAISFKVTGPGPTRWFDAKARKLDKDVAEAIDFGAELGKDIMESKMLQRREMRTPRMHTSVTKDNRGSNQFKRRVRFGWLRDPQDYFLYQEEGFKHVGGWKNKEGITTQIKGMFALKDAQAEAEEFVTQEINKIMRRNRV